MVRTKLLTGGIVAALVVGAWLCSPGVSSAWADDKDEDKKKGPTGTYLVAFNVGAFTLLAVANVHPDGTWTMSDQTDFGGIPGFESVSTPWRGIWKFTGKRETTFTGLALNFGDTGFPTSVQRITALVDWEKGFKLGEAVTTQRTYAAGEDPLDPDAGTPEGPPLNALPATLRKMTIPDDDDDDDDDD